VFLKFFERNSSRRLESGTVEHIFGPINLREHFPEDELTQVFFKAF